MAEQVTVSTHCMIRLTTLPTICLDQADCITADTQNDNDQ